MGWQGVADAMTISEDMSPYKPEGCFVVVHSAGGGSFATLAGSIVPAGDMVRVEVTPVSAYGTRGRPIAATVDGDALRSGTAKFGGLSVVGI